MTRSYELKARAESAAETRERIIDAVIERLRKAPAQRVSVDAVAKRAGVSRSTVYLIFGSRAGLFDAVAEEVYERAGYTRLLEAVRVPDAMDTLRGGITEGCTCSPPIATSSAPSTRWRSSSRRQPAARSGELEDQRAEGMMWLARRLSRQKQLQPGIKIKEAAGRRCGSRRASRRSTSSTRVAACPPTTPPASWSRPPCARSASETYRMRYRNPS